ncbi:MAG: asparagine synthase-related protein, partial [Azoarcus sp.]|nr:asparagine synthase-related protein [Azoarcus sp.]
MPEQFSGYFQHTTGAPALAALSPHLSRQDFQRGALAHASKLSTFSEDGLTCLSLGAPRFNDPSLRELCAHQGASAAWMRALRKDAEATLQEVKGRFCVVLISDNGNEVLLATDRFGTWPICYSAQAGALAFSDRADTVPGADRKISSQSAYEYLFFHMIPAPNTIFEDVLRLEAGHLLKWHAGSAQCIRWWTPTFDEHHTPDLAEAKAQFLKIIQDGVTHEAAGQNVGTFLSGGTDSSTVTGMLCKALGEPARSYSIGFDASGYDEMEYARIAAKHFGADHREYYVTPDDLLDGIPHVATHYDQPFGNSSAVPAWICAARAREDGIDKILAGDGGDELFGGNTRYAKQRIFGWYDSIPAALRRGLLEPS